MKINWKLRLQNKTTLAALITTVISFVYTILGIFDIVPKFSQDSVVQFAAIIVQILMAIGIVVDPTTDGVSDSSRAMGYSEPHKEDDSAKG